MKIIIIALIICFNDISFLFPDRQGNLNPIVDCSYTLEEVIKNSNTPAKILKELVLVDVEYFSFDDVLHRGQVLINRAAEKDIKEIFQLIKLSKFPIGKAIPIVRYNWNDQASMLDNNTSAFNYRKVKGQKVLSAHSYGLAIDINPIQNPHIKRNKIEPPNSKYDVNKDGTILKNSMLVKEFEKRGWQWGGKWKSSKDYQHFEKKK